MGLRSFKDERRLAVGRRQRGMDVLSLLEFSLGTEKARKKFGKKYSGKGKEGSGLHKVSGVPDWAVGGNAVETRGPELTNSD